MNDKREQMDTGNPTGSTAVPSALPGAQESPMFTRVVTNVTNVTPQLAPAGGRENGQPSPLQQIKVGSR